LHLECDWCLRDANPAHCVEDHGRSIRIAGAKRYAHAQSA
jgi:hypothetical protein